MGLDHEGIRNPWVLSNEESWPDREYRDEAHSGVLSRRNAIYLHPNELQLRSCDKFVICTPRMKCVIGPDYYSD